MSHPVSDEVRYRLLRYLAEHPEASQRELARVLRVSLGKVNYCLHALIEKGLVKARNFRKSRDKSVYAYLLTPKGLEEKINVTYAFLRRKIAEHDTIVREIEQLSAEVRGMDPSPDGNLLELDTAGLPRHSPRHAGPKRMKSINSNVESIGRCTDEGGATPPSEGNAC